MASYVELLVADPQRRLVVAIHYIGGNATVDAVHAILRRKPDHADLGFESWGRVTPDEIREIIEERYADGLSPETLAEWAERFPSKHYLWCLTRDY